MFKFLIVVQLYVYLLLSSVQVNTNQPSVKDRIIYLSDNGIHIDVIIPDSLGYTSYGCGSEVFYLSVPTWDDLTIQIVFEALFTNQSSVMHVTKYSNKQSNWRPVEVSRRQLESVVENIFKTFDINDEVQTTFYRANKNYSITYTCNTWANEVLKNSGLRACVWTPFSKDIIKIYN